jgi:tRNA (adenine22-N1)-methyltransferase
MSERLEIIASLICDGRGTADVGTDHGYLPVMLCRRGYNGALIASDINSGPLEAARITAREAGFDSCISFVLCDGLSGVDPAAIDTIVIAGMGGDTITGILDRDYWCASPEYRLIMQPMSRQNVLRYWLINNEFMIDREMLVRDGGTIYQVFTAKLGKSPKYSDAELYTGRFDDICGDKIFPDYLDFIIKKFTRSVAGMEAADAVPCRLGLEKRVLDELQRMKARL